MRPVSRTLAVPALTALALGVAIPSASADPAASVDPNVIGPRGTVTVTVMCDSGHGRRLPNTLPANGRILARGSIMLRRQDHTGTYRGSGQVADRLTGGPQHIGHGAQWAIDGRCPDGRHWSAIVGTHAKVPNHTAPNHTAPHDKALQDKALQDKAPHDQAPHNQVAHDNAPQGKAPHGKMRTGDGGSTQRSNSAMIAAGGAALAVAAGGGYLLMRRRSHEED